MTCVNPCIHNGVTQLMCISFAGGQANGSCHFRPKKKMFGFRGKHLIHLPPPLFQPLLDWFQENFGKTKAALPFFLLSSRNKHVHSVVRFSLFEWEKPSKNSFHKTKPTKPKPNDPPSRWEPPKPSRPSCFTVKGFCLLRSKPMGKAKKKTWLRPRLVFVIVFVAFCLGKNGFIAGFLLG